MLKARLQKKSDIPLSTFAAAPASVKEAIANIAGSKEQISRAELESAFHAATANPEQQALLGSALIAANAASKNPTGKLSADFWNGAGSASHVDTSAAVSTQELDPREQKFRDTLNRVIIGQERAKNDLAVFYRAIMTGKSKQPRSLVISGPPGVGKSEMVKALALSVNGSKDAYLTVDGTLLADATGYGKYFGIGAGYVGHGGNPQLSAKNMQEKFGSDGVKIILFDEIDKVGANDPKAKTQFWDKLNKALEEGVLQLEEGPAIDVKNAIFIFTSNAGADTAKGLTGKALQEHFIAETKKAIGRDHVISRLDGITAADPLSEEASSKIASMIVEGKMKEAAVDAKKDEGIDVRFDAAKDVSKLLGELALSPAYGARPLKRLISLLLEPEINDKVEKAQDEGHYRLELDLPKLFAKYDTKDTAVAISKMKSSFQTALPGLPDEFKGKGQFPIKFTTVSEPLKLQPYGGLVPHDPTSQLIPLSHGTVAGDGYVVLDKNTAACAKAQFFLLKEGMLETQDRYQEVKLPDDLAACSHDVQTVKLGENQVLFYGINAPEGAEEGDDAEAIAYVYTGGKRVAEPFSEIEAPPLPLLDGQLVALSDDRVMLTGGRVLSKEEGDRWSVSLDPTENNKLPVETESWVLDRNDATPSWKALKDIAPKAGEPQSHRTGVATVRRVDAEKGVDETWFIGGEEAGSNANATGITETSTNVDIFDNKKLEWRKGPDLPVGTAYAAAFTDDSNAIVVMGGAKRLDHGTDMGALDINLRLDPELNAEDWKRKTALPQASAKLAVIPHVKGYVVGPFYDDAKLDPSFQLLG
jgi:hypothetical protein